MLTVNEIREYIKDFAPDNYKYDDIIFSDDDIEVAIKWANKDVAILQPSSHLTAKDIPESIMLTGVLYRLFDRLAINRALNFDPGIQENGINLPLGEELQLYQQLAGNYKSKFEQELYNFKQNVNIMGALTAIRSPADRFK